MVGTNQDEIMDTDITDLGAISFNKENKIKADKYFKMLFWHDGYNDAVTWVHSTSLVYLVFRDLKPKNEDEKPNASRAELDAIFIVNYWKENGLVDSFNSNPLKMKDTLDKLFKEHKIDNNSYEELNKSIESERRRHVNRIARTFFEKRDIKLRLYDYIKLRRPACCRGCNRHAGGTRP